VFIWQFMILIAFFAFWEIASRLYWIDPLLFSSPSRIFDLLLTKFSDGSLLTHVQITLFETVLGFIIGTLLGIATASLLWSSPMVAVVPIMIAALGLPYVSIIPMGAIISVVITTVVIYSAFNEVDPNYEKVLKSFGATRFQCFKEAVFPATLPAMISTLKVNVGLSWVGVIVGEFLVSKQGLGYLIIYGFQVFDFSLVMSSLIVIAVIAAIMYKIVEKIEGWLIKHTG